MEQYQDIKMRCDNARAAVRRVWKLSAHSRNKAIRKIAERIMTESRSLLEANRIDTEAADGQIPEHMLERLRLDENKLEQIKSRLIALAALRDPLGDGCFVTMEQGITTAKKRVPLGAVAFVYDCRPELTAIACALCIKTCNASILSSSYACVNTDLAIIQVICDALDECDYPREAVTYIDPLLASVPEMLSRMQGSVDLIVYNGSRDLIDKLRDGSVPVLSSGFCKNHIYIDRVCDVKDAVRATVKSVYPRNREKSGSSVILVHKDIAENYLGALYKGLHGLHPEFRACPLAREYLEGAVPAVRGDWYSENSAESNIIAVRVVDSVKEAIDHINAYGTWDGEVIMTSDIEAAAQFSCGVDSSAVFVNSPANEYENAESGFGFLSGRYSVKNKSAGTGGIDALTGEKYIIVGSDTRCEK